MMQRGDELAVFDVSIQPLLGRHVTRSRKERMPRFIGEPRPCRGVRDGSGAGQEGTGFFRRRTGLENQVQTCTDRNANQQLERQLGDSPVHDLAERRLRYLQQLRGGRLAQLPSFEEPGDLQGNIATQRLDGGHIGSIHSESTIGIVNKLCKPRRILIYEAAGWR